MDSCLPGHLYLKEDTRTIDVAAGRVSVMGQSVRNGALRFVAGATSIQHSFALRHSGSIPIDAPECTQSMRQRSELCAILRTSSFLARPRLLPASQFAALFAPHVYTDLGPVGRCSVTTGVARGFRARAASRLYSCSAPGSRRTTLRQRNLAASKSMFTWIDVGFRVLFRAGRGQSLHLDRSVIYPKPSLRR